MKKARPGLFLLGGGLGTGRAQCRLSGALKIVGSAGFPPERPGIPEFLEEESHLHEPAVHRGVERADVTVFLLES